MDKSSSIAIFFIAACLSTSIVAARTPRGTSEIQAFKKDNPCPVTQSRHGPCPGYQVDHANPVCAGGSDTSDNMQWLTIEEHRMKTRSDLRMCRLHRQSK